MITALAGAFLVERRYFIYAGSAKPFQVSRPKAVVYVRNYWASDLKMTLRKSIVYQNNVHVKQTLKNYLKQRP